LSLFMFRIHTNYTHHAPPMDELAFGADLLYRCSNFHNLPSLLYGLFSTVDRWAFGLFESIDDPPACQIIRGQLDKHLVTRKNLDKILPHPP